MAHEARDSLRHGPVCCGRCGLNLSGDIRQKVGKTVYSSGRFFRTWRTNHYCVKLAILERLHGDVYELVLYLASEFTGAVVGAYRLLALYGVGVIVLVWSGHADGKSFFTISPLFFIMGGVVGKGLDRIYGS